MKKSNAHVYIALPLLARELHKADISDIFQAKSNVRSKYLTIFGSEFLAENWYQIFSISRQEITDIYDTIRLSAGQIVNVIEAFSISIGWK